MPKVHDQQATSSAAKKPTSKQLPIKDNTKNNARNNNKMTTGSFIVVDGNIIGVGAAAPKTEPPAFIEIPMPGPLNVSSGDTREHFECFEFAWQNYSIASGMAGKLEQVQLCQLVCALGVDAQRLLLRLALSDEQRSTVAGTLDGLRKHLCGSGNMRLDRFEFNRALQRPGESYADYFARLRVLLRRCKFGSTAVEEDFLLDRLLFSIRDKTLGRRMARERTLSLDQAIAWCLRNEKQRCERNRSAAAAAPELDSGWMPISEKPKASVATAATKATAVPAASVSTPLAAMPANATAPAADVSASTVDDLDLIAPPSYESTIATDKAEERRRNAQIAAEARRIHYKEAEDQRRHAEAVKAAEAVRQRTDEQRRQAEATDAAEAVCQRAALLQRQLKQMEFLESEREKELLTAARREKDERSERQRMDQLLLDVEARHAQHITAIRVEQAQGQQEKNQCQVADEATETLSYNAATRRVEIDRLERQLEAKRYLGEADSRRLAVMKKQLVEEQRLEKKRQADIQESVNEIVRRLEQEQKQTRIEQTLPPTKKDKCSLM